MTAIAPAHRALPADPSLISLVYTHEHGLEVFDFDNTVEQWSVQARIDAGIVAECLPSDADPDDVAAVRDIPVGRMEFVRVRMFGPDDPFQAMDSLTGDIAKIGEFTLTVGTRDWSPAFEQALAHPVGDLLVMDRVVLEPAWRGFGLGPVLAGSAIRRLSTDCVAVVCEPADAEGRDMGEADHERARRRLAATWSTVGFQPLEPAEAGLYFLDCHLQRPQDLLAERLSDFAALCAAYRDEHPRGPLL